MSIESLRENRSGGLAVWTVALLCAAQGALCAQTQPVITSIHPQGTNVIITVRVPAGAHRVTLESRAQARTGAWVPAVVTQTGGGGGTLRLSVGRGRQSALLRVRADASQPLPAAFYEATNSFVGPPTNSPALAVGLAAAAPLTGSNSATPADDTSRPVVESDIWQISGNTVYFFNQYRGLQVIDITDPDTATIVGRLPLPAAGEQMYLVDSNHVALLAQNYCGADSDNSQVVVVAVTNGIPQVVANLPVPGTIQASRMVGTALYVASQSYLPLSAAADATWEWGTTVSAFDLSDPEAPVSRGSLWYPGYGNVVTATDTYLFVATQDAVNWWQSLVEIIDITAPDGTMGSYGSLVTDGEVTDASQLNYTNQVFTSISQDWHLDDGSLLVTRLETFLVPAPNSAGPEGIRKLGELDLGDGQELHATSFAGNLVYVATAQQTDPLWVVDLSDPSQPQVAGSVEVPGWSTYIQPLGDRLVTVGVESNRVAVSLYDVSDPANPALLSNVLLGECYSWSVANNDDKAFTVLPDLGLIVVPYSGDTTNGWSSQVQLLDLNSNSIVARGIVAHECQTRRAAFANNRLLFLSDWDLLSVDATDRDQPVVDGDLELAWPVDRVFVQGDYVVEIAASTTWWGRPNQTVVRVAPAAQPDQLLAELPLGTLPVVGAAVQSGRLYLAQTTAEFYVLPLTPIDPAGEPPGNPTNFFVTIVDLSGLPNLAVLGSVGAAVDLPFWASTSWQAVWPATNLLVWAGNGWSWGFLPGPIPGGPVPVSPLSVGPVSASPGSSPPVSSTPVSGASGPGTPVSSGPVSGPSLPVAPLPGAVIALPIGGFGGGELLAFDVTSPATPVFVSEVDLVTNFWWSFSGPFAVGNLVYLSHNGPLEVVCPAYPLGVWVQQTFLDVVDYTDPLSPTLRAPVRIPGTLEGVASDGELLYTIGYHWGPSASYNWQQWLDASAYDGVAAHPVASLPLTNPWPNPVLIADTNIFIGYAGSSSSGSVVAGRLDTWTLPDSGVFTLLGSVALEAPASALLERGGLLAVEETDPSIQLFDPTVPAALRLIGEGSPASCLYFDLSQGDATLTGGLWVPLGMYGVGQIPVTSP